jgi:hypothetical protein
MGSIYEKTVVKKSRATVPLRNRIGHQGEVVQFLSAHASTFTGAISHKIDCSSYFNDTMSCDS